MTAPSNQTVRGWPNYIAMGAVTDDTTASFTSFQSRPIDAIFKYSGMGGNGDPGQIIYPIFDMQTANQANALTAYYKTTAQSHLVKPVMVIYTAEMSGGTSFKDFEADNLEMHYINLMMAIQKLQTYSTKDNPYPASVILNPDLLGMIQQMNLLHDANQALNQVSINKALSVATCFITSPLDTPYGKGLNYEALYQAIRAKTTDNWSAMSLWNGYKMDYLNQCKNNPAIPQSIQIPAFTNDLPGFVQSTNWIMKTFSPNITFGWQVNVWGVGSANWVHKNMSNDTLNATIISPTLETIQQVGMYKKPYPADFIVFDKYEMDAIPSATGVGYLFNARDWMNMLHYVKGISEGLNNLPVMLWQIPGGHLQQNDDVDTRQQNGSTEPDFFFGDTYNPLDNLKTYILSLSLAHSIYGVEKIIDYLSMDINGQMGQYHWQNSHLMDAKNSHVFAILWGGGNTTSVGVFPSDDGGWLASKIKHYYEQPMSLK